MPNATLPEATNRRSFLRSVVAAGASITAAAPLALTCLPAVAAGETSAAGPEVNQDLFDLAGRIGELPREREQVVADLKSARDRFRETVPLPPKPRGKRAPEGMNLFKIVRNPAPFGSTRPIETSVDFAYDQWMEATSPNAVRNFFNVSDQYIGKLIRGADASGYEAALRRLRDLNNETARLLIKAFEFKPKTSRELSLQSAALLVALDIGRGPAMMEYAEQLAANVIRVASEEGARA
ncbi:MAG: hypothetical protein WAN05_04745 [Roseiarcus sp.]